MSTHTATSLRIKRSKLTEKGFTYETFRLVGWHNGERVRRQFKSREEAQGEKNRLEVAGTNEASQLRAVATHLSTEQVRTAEAVFKLTDDPVFAVQWFRANYRPGQIEMALGAPDVEGSAAAQFIADRAQHVRPIVLSVSENGQRGARAESEFIVRDTHA